jgi:hypothetical protein
MVFHSKVSGVISLPRCIRISMLELSNGPVLHKSVYIIGVGYLCGILIRIHRYAGCDPGFLRGDPFPLWIGPPLSRRPYIGHTYPIPFFSLFCESTRSSGKVCTFDCNIVSFLVLWSNRGHLHPFSQQLSSLPLPKKPVCCESLLTCTPSVTFPSWS